MTKRDEAVRTMYVDLRWSVRAIGKALGVSHMTVARDLKRLGIERRGKGRAA
jgi:IS30 family transposase